MPSTDGVCAFLKAHVLPGMFVVDVGANEGAVVSEAAYLVGPTGRVLAYEPFPASAAGIAARHRDDPHVSVIEAAVSDEAGASVLYLDSQSSGRHSLWPKGPVVRGGSMRVKTVRLDDDLAATPAVDVLKIDAQGAEARILRGGRNLLVRDQPLVILELWRKGFKVAGGDASTLLNELAAVGYRPHPINAKGVVRSDRELRKFLAGDGAASLNVVAHPRQWPAGRWPARAVAAPCPISTRPTCRPWIRTPAISASGPDTPSLWRRIRRRLTGRLL